MSVVDKIIPIRFHKVTFYRFGDWPDNWLYNCVPGDLLLVSKDDTVLFGYLCVDADGTFFQLTAEQIQRQKPIPWVNHTEPDRQYRIIADELVLID